MSPQQQRQGRTALSEEASVSNMPNSIQPSQAQILRHHMLVQRGLSSAVSTTEIHAEQQQEQHPVASATATSFSSPVNHSQTCQALTGSEILLQLTRQRQSLFEAMSANESNIQQLLLQLSVAPASDVLLQLIQQRQGLSNAMAATESNIQLLLQRIAVAQTRNASTSSPVSLDMMLQGLEGSSLLRLLLLRIQSQQGIASAAPATVRNSQLQLPVDWAPTASTSSSFSPEQILHSLSSDPDFLQNVMQNIHSRQGLSSAAAATESDMHLQQQDLAFMVSRVNAARSGMASHSAPSNRDDRADAPAAASSPPSFPSSGIAMGLPDDNHHLSEYQITIRQHLEIFEAEQEDVKSNKQGRKRRVFLGQAGIRCRHCSNLELRKRGRGAVYYPVKLNGMYQAAQNMATSHLSDCCSQIHPGIKQRLQDLRLLRETASGGKEYWAEAGSALGLYETEDGLRLLPGTIP
jgi:hypothetical protein